MADLVVYERVGSAAVVTINRPERRNAVDGPTGDALQDAYEQFVADDDALALVVTGAGAEAFCAGADLKAIDSFAERILAGKSPLGFTREISPKPTVAAVSGYALAGGFELALWCDLRVCAEGAVFGFTERRFGVPLIDGGTQRIARVVGLGAAMDLVLTGRMIELDEAEHIGLVTRRVAAGQHLTAALELVEQLAAFPRETMLADREALLASFGMPLAEGIAMEARNIERTAEIAAEGGARFTAGEGRGGAQL